jgi:cytochrome c peroxidase
MFRQLNYSDIRAMRNSGKHIHTLLLWLGTFLVALASSLIFSWSYWQHAGSANTPSHPLTTVTSSTEPITPLPQSIPGLDKNKVELGKRLFHETRLSGGNSVACNSCHPLDRGGMDHMLHPVDMDGTEGLINTLTVFNCQFNFRQFWDGRAATLEDQVGGPLTDPYEMNSSWGLAVSRLQADPSYRAAFSASYRDGITPDNIRDAIATFERTLVTPNSRFDKYLRGDNKAITAEEAAGYDLFKNYGCINCHQGANVGGNMYEKLGIMREYFNDKNGIKRADMGRYAITHIQENLHEFRVPSLRNVAVSAPYFHNGSVNTLDEAVAVMGKYQLGLDLPREDIARITAFLKTLTGEYNGKPL